jgi:Tol biopolymer transport system component
MSLAIGTEIGPYRVVERIGAGGMGEVYRARDAKLARDVALKVLPPTLATDDERLLRFEREAKTLASLNHPHIAQIYGFEQGPPTADRPPVAALAMEFVDGDDLATRLARGRVPLDEAVSIARQMADALAAAHAAGIVHRDLKPANVKVRRDGMVKVLDFGLAKPAIADPRGDPHESPTITSPLTMQGVLLGTAAYMAPEQARGRAVDHRADVWAFGCVLYELLTGVRLFDADSVTETLAGVLKSDVDLSRLPADTPPVLRRLLRRCLQRDPERRLHAMADARLELEEPTSLDEPADTASRAGRGRRRMLALAALAAGLGAAAMWLARPPQPVDARVRTFAIPGAGFNFSGLAAVSRDGRWLAYVPDAEAPPFRLYLRSLDGFDSRELVASLETGLNPFFSPDGRWIAYFSSANLYKSPTGGGDAQLVAPTPGPDFRQGAWGPDGTIVVSTGGTPGASDGLWKLEPGQSELARLTDPPEREAHLAPEILPDGRTVLFTLRTVDAVSIAAVPLDGGVVRTVMTGARSPRYLASGHLFFQRSGSDDLMLTRFDPASLSASGDPQRLATIAVVNEVAAYAVADEGTLIYSAPGETAEDTRYSIVAVDRGGNERVLLDAPGNYAQPRVSPDGQSILYRQVGVPFCDLWTLDLARGIRTRVTVEGDNHDPLWHPNGRDIVWTTQLPSGFEVRMGPVDRSRPVRTLVKGSEGLSPASWTRDGRLLAYIEIGPGPSPSAHSTIHLLDTQTGETRRLTTSRFRELTPAFSPDGQWIAWASDETGAFEIYIQRVSDGSGRLQVSTQGGTFPTWSSEGRELFYSESARLMRVTLQLGADPKAGRPERLVDGPYAWERFGNYDVMPDGRSFVFVKRAGLVGNAAILRVVLNWPQSAGMNR